MNGTRYFAPTELSEVLNLIKSHNEITDLNKDPATPRSADHVNFCIVAGGTDVMPRLNANPDRRPMNFVFIGNLHLNYIIEEPNRFRFGATTSLSDILASESVKRRFPVLQEAVGQMAGIAIRNAATIGGNVVNASPAGDCIPPLIALDAELVLQSSASARTIPIADFFIGPGVTMIQGDELLTEIIIPVQPGSACFMKVGRRKTETLSVVNTCVRAAVRDGICGDIRIASGAVASTPLRCRRAENVILGRQVNDEVISQTAESVLQEISPIDDLRASAWYRNRAAKALIERSLRKVMEMERGVL